MRYTTKEFRSLKLSDAIPVFIEELKAAHGAGLQIIMNDWFTLKRGEAGDVKVCGVCLGGAIIAVINNFDQKKLLESAALPLDFDNTSEEAAALRAIAFVADDLRNGEYWSAIRRWSPYEISHSQGISEIEDEHFSEYLSFPGKYEQKHIDLLISNLTDFALILKQNGL